MRFFVANLVIILALPFVLVTRLIGSVWLGPPPTKLTERRVGDVLVLTVAGSPFRLDRVVRKRAGSEAKKIVINLEKAKLLIGIPDTFAACMEAADEHGVELRWFCGDNENQGAVVFACGVFAHRQGLTELETEDLWAKTCATANFETEAEAIESFADAM